MAAVATHEHQDYGASEESGGFQVHQDSVRSRATDNRRQRLQGVKVGHRIPLLA